MSKTMSPGHGCAGRSREPGRGRHRPAGTAPPFLGLYVHIPFCDKLCPYCHFYREGPPGPGMEEAYLKALLTEARDLGEGVPGPVRTLYLGGGNPSLLSLRFHRALLRGLGELWPWGELIEATVEANGDASPDLLKGLVECGYGRVSLGVQSFRPSSLALLGRRQDPTRTAGAMRALREAGAGSVSLDLIYAFQGQESSHLEEDLRRALDLEPDHLSLYSLQGEEGGPREGDPDAMAGLFRAGRRLLLSGGFYHYEICNFARPGHRCLHNRNYWADGDYLGLGPSAHSSLTREGTRRRWRNRPGLGDYLSDPLSLRETLEEEGGEERAPEALILALRTAEGVEPSAFGRRYGVSPWRLLGPLLPEFSGLGLLRASQRRIRLTPRGMLLSNELFSQILA